MPVQGSMQSLTAVAASNSPAGSDSISNTLDDYLRSISAILRHTEAQGAALTSTASMSLAAAAGGYVHVSGTDTISHLGTAAAGILRTLVFDDVLTLTHNATNLILPTGANITTAAGDIAVFRSEGSGNWRCISYARANGSALAYPSTFTTVTVLSTATISALAVLSTATLSAVTVTGSVSLYETFTSTSSASNSTPVYAAITAKPSELNLLDGRTFIVPTMETEVLTTSGSSVEISTGITAEDTRFTIVLDTVSTNGTSVLHMQIGTASDYVTSDYISGAGTVTSAGACDVDGPATGSIRIDWARLATSFTHGSIQFQKIGLTSHRWVWSGVLYSSSATTQYMNLVAGSVAAGAQLTKIKIYPVNGTDEFDGGRVLIVHE